MGARNKLVRGLAAVGLFALGSASSPPSRPPVPEDYFSERKPDLLLLTTSDGHGEIEPCGCSRVPKGGLARRAAFVDSMRATHGNVLVVEAGDFSLEPTALSEAKNLFVIEVMRRIGYDAINPGTRELKIGLDVLLPVARDCPVPFVSANLRDKNSGAPLFRESVVLKKGPWNIGVTGVTIPPVVDRPVCDSLGVSIADPREALGPVLEELRSKSDLVVLLAHMNDEDARALGKELAEQVDIVVVGVGAPGRDTVPEPGDALYVNAGDRGQAMGLVRIAMGEDRPVALVGEEILLVHALPLSPEIAKATDDFRRHLNELSKVTIVQKFAGGRKSPDGEFYMGASSCASCHAREYEIWSETSHAHAFATLSQKGSESLAECFVCHVTGARDPVGYDPGFDQARELVNVQCEVCHDKGSAHARDGSYGKELGHAACKQCHDAENSPDFDPEVYWLMIEH